MPHRSDNKREFVEITGENRRGREVTFRFEVLARHRDGTPYRIKGQLPGRKRAWFGYYGPIQNKVYSIPRGRQVTLLKWVTDIKTVKE